jgi:RHS repeat-associated protein
VSGSYEYQYYLKDHLGNTRAVVKGTQAAPVLMQEFHYYPFGMQMDGTWATPTGLDQKYKYNGKELVDDLGLNWYDYGARWYDPSVSRWMQVDPMAEKFVRWSPYNYCINNPVAFIDPDGMEFTGRGALDVTAPRGGRTSTIRRTSDLEARDRLISDVENAAAEGGGQSAADQARAKESNLTQRNYGEKEGTQVKSKASGAEQEVTSSSDSPKICIPCVVVIVAILVSAPEVDKSKTMDPVKDEIAIREAEQMKNDWLSFGISAPVRAEGYLVSAATSTVGKSLGAKKGKRAKSTDDAREQFKGIDEAQKNAQKERPSINEGEWEGSNSRPKQNKIQSTEKSKQRDKQQKW